jgi:hypothetical protein
MMLSTMLVAAAFTAGPVYYDGGYAGGGYGGGAYAGGVAPYGSFDAYGFGGQLYPYDGPEPWLHGYFQEIPAYGGYTAFRPYNYKHVLSQSQTAGGWGLNPTMPYSQQFWHRYHAQATMSPTADGYDPAPGYVTPPPPAPVTPIGHRSAAGHEWPQEQARLRRSFR